MNLIIKPHKPVCLKGSANKSAVQNCYQKTRLAGDLALAENCVLITGENELSQENPQKKHASLGTCLQILVGKELIDYFSRDGSYLVSPGWLSTWSQNLKEWGFDQTIAGDFFHESTRQITLLETGVDSESINNLHAFAEYLDLPTQVIPVGLDHFRAMVLPKIIEWKKDQEFKQLSDSATKANEQAADFALVFDVIANISHALTETQAMLKIDQVITTLFSPTNTIYISLVDGIVQKVVPTHTPPEKVQELSEWSTKTDEDYHAKETSDGFFLRISHDSETFGVLDINQVAFPQYLQKYINTSLVVSPLLGLAISESRINQKLKEKETMLESLASTDSLTGLFNRRYFMKTAETEFERAKRYNTTLSAIMMDIDHFKQINDTYGHPAGDVVLIEFSRQFSVGLRKSDIPARMGGDEFIVLLPETNLDMAAALAERLRLKFLGLQFSGVMKSLHIATSMGVAEINDTCATLDEFLHHCDQALYEAKNKGRNCVALWSQTSKISIKKRNTK